jgi:hypothetical protein
MSAADSEDAPPTADDVPWSNVSSFLALPDALSLRLASRAVADGMQGGLGLDECSAWLERELVARNVHLFNSREEWMHARRTMSDGGDGGQDDDFGNGDGDSKRGLMGWLFHHHPGKQRRLTRSMRCCAACELSSTFPGT